jgi:hypothetical protein
MFSIDFYHLFCVSAAFGFADARAASGHSNRAGLAKSEHHTLFYDFVGRAKSMASIEKDLEG